MSESEIAQAIRSLRIGAEFSFTDGDYSTIVWDKLEGGAPSQSEITTEIARLKKQVESDKAEAQSNRAKLLERLGLTADEAKLLIG